MDKWVRLVFAGGVLLCTVSLGAQTQVISQIADGGGWQTTLVLANTTTSTIQASLSFYEDTSGGATENWNPPLLETVSLQDLSLPGGGTLFLHTKGTAAATSQGWGQLQGAAGVVCYAIFTLHQGGGRPDLEGTAPATAPSSRVLMPFDNTAGLSTQMAVVNPTAASETISVSVQTDTGSISRSSLPAIPALGHMAFALPQLLAATSGKRGLVEFYSASGNVSILALQANPTLSFTSAQAYTETGPPIIGATGSPPPTFSQITLITNWALVGGTSGGSTITVTPNADGTTYTALAIGGAPVFFDVTFTNGHLSDQTFTFTSINAASAFMSPLQGTASSGSLTVTLNNLLQEDSTFSGTMTIAGAGVTDTGPVSGTYTYLP